MRLHDRAVCSRFHRYNLDRRFQQRPRTLCHAVPPFPLLLESKLGLRTGLVFVPLSLGLFPKIRGLQACRPDCHVICLLNSFLQVIMSHPQAKEYESHHLIRIERVCYLSNLTA